MGLASSFLKKKPDSSQFFPVFLTVYDSGWRIGCAVQTDPHRNLILYGNEVFGEAAAKPIYDLYVEKKIPIPGIIGEKKLASSFAEAWSKASGIDPRMHMNMLVNQLDEVAPVDISSGRMREATEKDISLVAKWAHKFSIDALGESDEDEALRAAQTNPPKRIYLWEDNGLVSMAGITRASRNGIAINYVYTPPQFRKKGYATSCVAKLSELMLQRGFAFCCLFTDVYNPTSNKIYQEIGYRPIGEFVNYVFPA